MTDVEIVLQVNAEIRGMYNYYSIAENAIVIKNFAFILEYSMYKTFGLKYRRIIYVAISRFFLLELLNA